MRRLRFERTTNLSVMSNPRRDSELDRLNLALSSAEMGTWDWDLPTGVIWWDERMHALFGLAPGAFKGATRTSLV
jgi:PAS domain-containing protein